MATDRLQLGAKARGVRGILSVIGPVRARNGWCIAQGLSGINCGAAWPAPGLGRRGTSSPRPARQGAAAGASRL